MTKVPKYRPVMAWRFDDGVTTLAYEKYLEQIATQFRATAELPEIKGDEEKRLRFETLARMADQERDEALKRIGEDELLQKQWQEQHQKGLDAQGKPANWDAVVDNALRANPNSSLRDVEKLTGLKRSTLGRHRKALSKNSAPLPCPNLAWDSLHAINIRHRRNGGDECSKLNRTRPARA